jgi:hypothetical protein
MEDNEQSVEGTPPAEEAAKPDLMQNLKSEFQRKTSNLEAMNQQLAAQLAVIQASLAPRQQSVPESNKKLEDVWYNSPAEAAAQIKEQAKTEMRQEMAIQNEKQSKYAATINQLVADFPELSDQTSELYLKSVANYDALSAEEKVSPIAYKAAVRDAALDLGVKPKGKRKSDSGSDAYTMASGSGGVRSDASTGKVDAIREDIAAKMGLKLDDAMKARLKSYNKKDTRSWE